LTVCLYLKYLDIKELEPVSLDKLKPLTGGTGVHVFLVLWKAAHAVETYAEKSVTDLEMCGSDFAVLEALLHKGPLPVNEIGKKVLLTSGSITVAVDRLEQKNLVERRAHGSDRRARIVHLTKKGRMGQKAVIETRTPIIYLHYRIKPAGAVIQRVPSAYNAFAYVVEGEGLFGAEAERVGEGQMVLLASDGDEVRIENPADAKITLEVLLIAGVPLNEPVARYGPFVMNTQAEIRQAIEDYRLGRMGAIDS
jgi:DNA-binding MarR family transcriptional regulator